MSERTIPVVTIAEPRSPGKMLGAPTGVPWAFVEPHRDAALRNHGQTLERLAERGGLSWRELLAVVTGEEWWAVAKLPQEEAYRRVADLLSRSPATRP